MGPAAIAVEIGGTKLQAGLGTEADGILHTRRGAVDPAGGAEGILRWVAQEVQALLDEAPVKPTAIGVGFGGPVETATGEVLTSHQIAGWQGFPLRHWFESTFGLPALIANDANAAGWAEYRRGAGRGTRHFVYSNIGSGIGGALVLDGHLHDGQGRGAAEIGHTLIPDWTAAEPGAADKLEHLCSGWAIERRLRALPSLERGTPLARLCGDRAEALSCPMLAEAAREGDAFALAELDRIGRGIGIALANVITLFHPERVALGGGVALMGEMLLAPVRKHVDALVFGPYRERYEIVLCELGESVVLDGALLLALSA